MPPPKRLAGETLEQRAIRAFHRHVIRGAPHACWLWRKELSSSGYPRVYVKYHGKGRILTASRVAYMAEKGPIPKGAEIRHTCGERRCVNPSHLVVSTDRMGWGQVGLSRMSAAEKRIYIIWCHIRRRCGNPRDPAYNRYGGRGIYVCERWQKFVAFRDDMGPRPPGTSLDRIDNDGPYAPWNCRWATRQQQGSNKRNNIRVEWAGEVVSLHEACRRVGFDYHAVHKRVTRRNWPMDKALTIPVGTGKHAHKWSVL
jgi:hypothetical protein